MLLPPHEINSGLIDALHHAIAAHPHPVAKSTYGKMLAQALQEQVRAHAAGPVAEGSAAGGAQTASESGYPAGRVVAQPLVPELLARLAARSHGLLGPDLVGSHLANTSPVVAALSSSY